MLQWHTLLFGVVLDKLFIPQTGLPSKKNALRSTEHFHLPYCLVTVCKLKGLIHIKIFLPDRVQQMVINSIILLPFMNRTLKFFKTKLIHIHFDI